MRNELRTIKLPSGKTAAIRRGRGRDLMRAHRAVVGNPEPMSVTFALIAELVRLDDKALVYEDILEMDLDDVLTLENELTGAAESQINFPIPAAQQKEDADFLRPRQSSGSLDTASPIGSCE